jgi:hypothetical protein
MGGTAKLAFALAIVALAVGLTACGGAEDSTQSSSSTANTTQQATKTPGQGSASFRTPGGDNSIPNFGDEADAGEVAAATTVLASYLQARAKGDWGKDCALLAKTAATPLEQLAAKSPELKGKGCAGILAAFVAYVPKSSRAKTMTSGIASLRVQGDRGFALYHGAKGIDYFMPMVKEDGQWKVGSLAASEFP